jgi:hypothetical protein
MLVLSKLNFVVWLKALFQVMYVCFLGSLNKYLEFQNLCEMFIEKENKLPIRNVKMKWINMLFLMKRVIKLYWLVITKVQVNDAPNNSIASEKLNLLYDLVLILRLYDIMLLIDFMHALIKLAEFHTMCLYVILSMWCNVTIWTLKCIQCWGTTTRTMT